MSEHTIQRLAVMEVMADGRYRTLFELDAELRKRGYLYLTTSISARLRQLRNAQFGGWTVEARLRSGRTWEYALRPPRPAKQAELFQEARA